VFFLLPRGQLESTVAEEMEFNPRLSKSLEEFVEIMNNLNLPYPKKIGEFALITVIGSFHDEPIDSQVEFDAALALKLNSNCKNPKRVVPNDDRQFSFSCGDAQIINFRFAFCH
jgi:hypothetical protein